MNDPGRRQVELLVGWGAGLRNAGFLGVLALTASCGGGHAGDSAQASQASQAEPAERGSRVTERANVRTGAPVQMPNEDDDLPPVLKSNGVVSANLCTRDPVAFDLSRMTPVDPTSAGFASAWTYAQAKSEIPGFVVAYTGTASGPVVQATVGSVYPVADNIYSFMNVLTRGAPEDVGRNASNPFRMSSYSQHEFITAFGTVNEREGFVVSAVSVEGTLDSRCQSLRDVRVILTLPKTNIAQPFGGTTMDAALGPMTVDSDGDGEPDSWSVTLGASSLHNLMFRL